VIETDGSSLVAVQRGDLDHDIGLACDTDTRTALSLGALLRPVLDR
jgi:hypothetical protein